MVPVRHHLSKFIFSHILCISRNNLSKFIFWHILCISRNNLSQFIFGTFCAYRGTAFELRPASYATRFARYWTFFRAIKNFWANCGNVRMASHTYSNLKTLLFSAIMLIGGHSTFTHPDSAIFKYRWQKRERSKKYTIC